VTLCVTFGRDEQSGFTVVVVVDELFAVAGSNVVAETVAVFEIGPS
jgi:hypothetical protein